MLMIDPPPASSISGIAARHARTALRKFTRHEESQSSSDIRINGTTESDKLVFDQDTGGYYRDGGMADNIDKMEVDDLENPYQLSWTTGLLCRYNETITFYVKARVRSSSPGTLSVVRSI